MQAAVPESELEIPDDVGNDDSIVPGSETMQQGAVQTMSWDNILDDDDDDLYEPQPEGEGYGEESGDDVD